MKGFKSFIMNLSLFWKVLVLVIFVSTIPMLVLMLISSNLSFKQGKDLAFEMTGHITDAHGSDMFDGVIGSAKVSLESLSVYNLISDYLNFKEEGTDYSKVITEIVREEVEKIIGLDTVAIYYKTGEIFPSDFKNLPENRLIALMNETQTRDYVFTEVYKNNKGENCFAIARALRNSNREVVGVLIAEFNDREIKEEILDEYLDNIVRLAFIIDGNGKVFASSLKDFYNVDVSKFDLFSVLTKEKPGELITELSLDFRNEKYIGTVYKSSSSDMYFGYFESEREAFKEAITLRNLLIILNIVFALLALIFTFVFVRATLTKPVKLLRNAVEKIAEGDFAVEIPYYYKDELGQIAESVKRLVSNVGDILREISFTSETIEISSTIFKSKSDELNQVAQNNARAVELVNTNAQNTSASVEETTAGIDEVATGAQNVAASSEKISHAVSDIVQLSAEGKDVVKQIAEVIETTLEKAKITNESVEELTISARNIGEIVETINSIAEQTNLLALNAAIEAARAGEAGRGFAVVADEIRKLAEESKQATGKIGQILRAIQQKVENASKATEETTKVINQAAEGSKVLTSKFDTIESSIKTMSQMIESLVAAAEEMSAAAEEMNSAMDLASRSVTEVSSQVGALTENVNTINSVVQSIIQESLSLSEIARQLTTNVSKFKLQ